MSSANCCHGDTPEGVALQLMYDIMRSEGKAPEDATRAYILELYAQCIHTVRHGRHDKPKPLALVG